MRIEQTERETYESAWALLDYAKVSPGEQWASIFMDMAKPAPQKYERWGVDHWGTVLDAGCGTGKGALALQALGFNVTLCDITPAGLLPEVAGMRFVETSLWANVVARTGPHDWVYCCDVLEHVPLQFTMLVVHRLLEVAKCGVFLSISLMPDGFGAWIGKPLHQSVQTFVQWRDQIAAIGHLKEARDLLHTGVYYVERA